MLTLMTSVCTLPSIPADLANWCLASATNVLFRIAHSGLTAVSSRAHTSYSAQFTVEHCPRSEGQRAYIVGLWTK